MVLIVNTRKASDSHITELHNPGITEKVNIGGSPTSIIPIEQQPATIKNTFMIFRVLIQDKVENLQFPQVVRSLVIPTDENCGNGSNFLAGVVFPKRFHLSVFSRYVKAIHVFLISHCLIFATKNGFFTLEMKNRNGFFTRKTNISTVTWKSPQQRRRSTLVL